ncbi:TetR/AcrR family transcriptional regulator [Bacillus sp. N9]
MTLKINAHIISLTFVRWWFIIREKLINAAIKQYALHGYHGATVKKIADEVGIKPPSIYFSIKIRKIYLRLHLNNC